MVGGRDLNDVKERALELRKKGLTYKEISSALDGAVSVDWCKRNLKAVQKEKITDACIEELIKEATKPEGISVYEANAIIYKRNQNKALSKDAVSNLRKKAKRTNEDCVFRPAWLDPVKPQDSYKTMFAYIDHLINEVENVVRWYCDTYPLTNPSAVRYELTKYLFPKISGETLAGRTMRTEDIVETLASRNIQEVSVMTEKAVDVQEVKTDTDLYVTDADLLESVYITEEEMNEIWGCADNKV